MSAMRVLWWPASVAGSARRPWPSACAATRRPGGRAPSRQAAGHPGLPRDARLGAAGRGRPRRGRTRAAGAGRHAGRASAPRPAAGAPGAARTGRRRAGAAAARPAVGHAHGPAGRGGATARGTGRAAAPAAARLRGGAARAGGRGGGLGPPRSRPDRGPGSPVLRRPAHSSHRFSRTARSSGTQPAAGGRRVPSRWRPDAAGRRAGPAGSGISGISGTGAGCAAPRAGRHSTHAEPAPDTRHTTSGHRSSAAPTRRPDRRARRGAAHRPATAA